MFKQAERGISPLNVGSAEEQLYRIILLTVCVQHGERERRGRRRRRRRKQGQTKKKGGWVEEDSDGKKKKSPTLMIFYTIFPGYPGVIQLLYHFSSTRLGLGMASRH